MKVIEALRTWCEDDHEDAVKLTRHEIITLIGEYDAIIEECARVAEVHPVGGKIIATAIRALKDKP